MIEVRYNVGDEKSPRWGLFRHCNDGKKRYWLTIRGLSGAGGFTPFCVCPVDMWSKLQKAAIEQGFEASSFITPKPERKRSNRRSPTRKSPGISIF